MVYIMLVWCVTGWTISTNVSHMPIGIYASIWFGMVHCCIHYFLPAKTLFILVYLWYYYTYCVLHLVWRLRRLWNFISMSIWKFHICFVKFLLVVDRYLTFKTIYVVYIIVGCKYISMIITRPLNGLGWFFP